MKKNLSWKVLLPLGALIWLLGKVFSDSTLGSFGALLGLIILALGVVDVLRATFSKKKTDQ